MQEDYQHHISRRFNRDLAALLDQLLKMGGLVEQQLREAVQALTEADTGLAEQVRSHENKVNQLDLSLSNGCMQALALRQPAASDLRMILAINKCAMDLERIGDEADKIAKMAITLASEDKPPNGYVEVRHIHQSVSSMLHDALHAFVREDVALAVAVATRDAQVDLEYQSAIRTLITFMMEEPRTIGRVLNIIWVLRSLERIGDHACNLAEQVIYLVKGRDMRHATADEMAGLVKRDN